MSWSIAGGNHQLCLIGTNSDYTTALYATLCTKFNVCSTDNTSLQQILRCLGAALEHSLCITLNTQVVLLTGQMNPCKTIAYLAIIQFNGHSKHLDTRQNTARQKVACKHCNNQQAQPKVNKTPPAPEGPMIAVIRDSLNRPVTPANTFRPVPFSLMPMLVNSTSSIGLAASWGPGLLILGLVSIAPAWDGSAGWVGG